MKNHPYEPSAGPRLCTCGKSFFHEEHFNGSRVHAADAFHEHQAATFGGSTFYANSKHPFEPVPTDFSGACKCGRGQFAGIHYFDGQALAGSVPSVARAGRAVGPIIPPKFSAPEEAEAWMEENAPAMGVVYPDLPPQFASQDEADEWLARRAGEPYIPPSWDDAADSIRAMREAAKRFRLWKDVLHVTRNGLDEEIK